MAQFTIEIPDELMPGLVAEYGLVSGQYPGAEAYLAASAVEMVRQRCEIHRVGPYYRGPVPPKFNADGTFYTPPVEPAPAELSPTDEDVVNPVALLPEATSVGEEFTDAQGQLWRVVQATDEAGLFLSDDPETSTRESLRWVPVALVDGLTGEGEEGAA